MAFLNYLLQIDSTLHQDLFSMTSYKELIIKLLVALISGLIIWIFKIPGKLWSFIKKYQNKQAKSIWKFEIKVKDIKSNVHFNITNFKKDFYIRDSFKSAQSKFIEERKNLILTGRSGLGKTRAVFEILSKSKKKLTILIPFLTIPESFDFKTSFKKRRKIVLFIDDLQKYTLDDINYYLENLISTSSEVQLLCTCRTEHDEHIFNSFQIPNLERCDLTEWTITEGKSLANMLNIPFDEKLFDQTAGSLLYRLDKIKEQYKQLTRNQKAVLESIKLLKTLTLKCNSGSVKEVCEKVFDLDRVFLNQHNWNHEFNNLNKIGFYNLDSKGEVIINDVYISELVEFNFSTSFNRFIKFAIGNKDSVALFHCGLYLETHADFPTAKKCYKEAITIFPKHASAYFRLGSMYLARADQQANKLSSQSKHSILISLNNFHSAVTIKSDNYKYFSILAYAYAKAAFIDDTLYHDSVSEKQNLEKAISNFDKAINLNPQSSNAYGGRGFSNFKLGNLDSAILDYEKAIQLNPFSPNIYYLMGLYYNECKQDNKALNNYRYCLELKPDYYKAYNDIGHILHKQSIKPTLTYLETKAIASSAIRNYLKAIWYSRGGHTVAYSNLGHLYIDIGEFEKAIKVQTLAINKSPNYSEAYRSRAYCYNKLRKFLFSETDLLHAIKLDPQNESALHSLAYCYQELGFEKLVNKDFTQANIFFTKAIQYYDKLILGKDSGRQISGNLGKAITFYKMNEKEKATAIFKNIFTDNSDNDKVFSSIVNLLSYDKNDEQILNFLKLVLELFKLNKIKHISKNIMEVCTFQIQRFAKDKVLSTDIEELLALLKLTYPANYFVYKTTGVYHLNRGIIEQNPETKMKFYKKAEKEFSYGKLLVPHNPVFRKYLGVTNAKMCLIIKNRIDENNQTENLTYYNKLIDTTNKIFEDAEILFPNYPELKVEHSIFLYNMQILDKASQTEEEARIILSNHLATGIKNKTQIEEELKELEEIKSKQLR